ncbi:MAG TPA: glycoside hydrolase family 6 protein [Thermomicrobiales bacterium]
MIARSKLVMAVLVAALMLSALPQGIWGGGAEAAGNPFAGIKWFRHDPQSPVEQKMQEWRASRPGDADMLNYIAQEQTVDWIGGWFDDNTMAFHVNNRINDYERAGGLPIMAVYNVPNRDCGGFSQGGATNGDQYRAWIERFARAINGRRIILLVEPDGLTVTDCLGQAGTQERFALISYAVGVFKRNPNAAVYIDGGDNNRNRVDEIVPILQAANVAQADGFFLNSTVFQYTSTEVAYGDAVGTALGGKHFVVDTSRNGLGPGQEGWCNAKDRALGTAPTTQTGSPLADAFIWLKPVWQSDGECEHGEPGAGAPYFDYAVNLVRRSLWPFGDLPGDGAEAEAVRALTLRGVIRGNGDGSFGPHEPTLRAQMAALIARPLALELESNGNKFPDRCDASGCVDGALWRNVGALASRGVAQGFEDGTYNPRSPVLYGQTILFISRGLVKQGYWTLQADNAKYFTNVPSGTEREKEDRRYLTTYLYYTQSLGGIPGQATTGTFSGIDQPAPRAWFALALYRALQTAYLK